MAVCVKATLLLRGMLFVFLLFVSVYANDGKIINLFAPAMHGREGLDAAARGVAWWFDGSAVVRPFSGNDIKGGEEKSIRVPCSSRSTAMYRYVREFHAPAAQIGGFDVSALALAPHLSKAVVTVHTIFSDQSERIDAAHALGGAYSGELLKINVRFQRRAFPVSVLVVLGCSADDSTSLMASFERIQLALMPRFRPPSFGSLCPHHQSALQTTEYMCSKKSRGTDAPLRVALATHGTADRMSALAATMERWRGPMYIALHQGKEESAAAIKDKIRSLADKSEAIHIAVSISSPRSPEAGYPINALRNAANACAENPRSCGCAHTKNEEWVGLFDADIVPSSGIPNALVQALKLNKYGDRVVFVVPSFEQRHARARIPRTKAELLRSVQRGKFGPYKEVHGPRSHRATNFTRWKDARAPYPAAYELGFEPYVIVNSAAMRTHFRWPNAFDERFYAYGWNKVSFALELDAAGFQFVVLPDAWCVHMRHPKTSASASFSHNLQTRVRNRHSVFSHYVEAVLMRNI